MDLRTKLVFSLVVVSLASMLALAALSYPQTRVLLRDSARQTLEGIVESKSSDLDNLVDAWRDRVGLITSRTQLRFSLDAYNRNKRQADRALIQRIVADAVQSGRPTLLGVTIRGVDGEVVAMVGEAGPPANTEASLPLDGEGIRFDGVSALGPDGLRVSFRAPLTIDDRQIGAALVVMDAIELIELVQDTTSLGATGEVLIARRDGDSVQIITPLRHVTESPRKTRIPLTATRNPIVRAVLGEGGSTDGRGIDDRGETVWTATRFLPDVAWGLAVKIDADEQEQPIRALRNSTIRLALALSAFAVLVGTLLGLHIARPIHELADVANRIRGGELSARAKVDSNDEIGQLARTFNLMADEVLRERQSPQPARTSDETD